MLMVFVVCCLLGVVVCRSVFLFVVGCVWVLNAFRLWFVGLMLMSLLVVC